MSWTAEQHYQAAAEYLARAETACAARIAFGNLPKQLRSFAVHFPDWCADDERTWRELARAALEAARDAEICDDLAADTQAAIDAVLSRAKVAKREHTIEQAKAANTEKSDNYDCRLHRHAAGHDRCSTGTCAGATGRVGTH